MDGDAHLEEGAQQGEVGGLAAGSVGRGHHQGEVVNYRVHCATRLLAYQRFGVTHAVQHLQVRPPEAGGLGTAGWLLIVPPTPAACPPPRAVLVPCRLRRDLWYRPGVQSGRTVLTMAASSSS